MVSTHLQPLQFMVNTTPSSVVFFQAAVCIRGLINLIVFLEDQTDYCLVTQIKPCPNSFSNEGMC